ncbi:AAA family ATPase [archaeon]|nr:AAA family ATPase [archaeon]MBT6761721.1 AAA family ATPase [archaeon]
MEAEVESEIDVAQIEEENRRLQTTLRKLEEEASLLRALFNKTHHELENLKKPALLVADIVAIHEGRAVVKLPNGNKFYSYIASTEKDIVAGDAVLVEQKSLNVLGKIDLAAGIDVEKYVLIEKPNESWKQIGGLKKEVQEIKEVIELPLTKPKLFEKMGIVPPKGVLLHGPPGTGKTLLAKAVAHSTQATFIEVVGSELVQKFIGEGSKLVKEIFALARRKAPTILFIDELDALASARMPMGTSGEREVNRTFMQLLAELDGFRGLDKVKIIAATNRKDILDLAILRPGRLDRIIEVGMPDEAGRLEILKIHTGPMSLKKVKLKDVAHSTEGFSGAELKAVCTEAGYFAIRENRDHLIKEDFDSAVEKVKAKDLEEDEVHIFG